MEGGVRREETKRQGKSEGETDKGREGEGMEGKKGRRDRERRTESDPKRDREKGTLRKRRKRGEGTGSGSERRRGDRRKVREKGWGVPPLILCGVEGTCRGRQVPTFRSRRTDT